MQTNHFNIESLQYIASMKKGSGSDITVIIKAINGQIEEKEKLENEKKTIKKRHIGYNFLKI